MKNKLVYWICQFIGWTIYLIINLIVSFSFQPFNGRVALHVMIYCVLGFSLSHAFRSRVHHYQWNQLPIAKLAPRLFVINIIISFIWLMLTYVALLLNFGINSIREFNPGVALTIWFNMTATMLIWSLIYFGVHLFVNYKQAEVRQWQLEANVKEMELRVLKKQMNPHFLFNCLNSIRALIIEEPERAQDAVTKLAGILRYSLQSSEVETSTLSSELRFVEDYIGLETIRFEDRLAVHMHIAPDTLDYQIPPMTLQILVENGIKHGIARLPAGGEITIKTWLEAQKLHIRVSNTGTLTISESSTRLGIKNATERLKLIFGNTASLSLADNNDNYVTAEVIIPVGEKNDTRTNNR